MKKVLKDTPTKVLIWLLLVFITVFSLTSCSDNRSGHFLDGTAKFRVKEAVYSVNTDNYVPFSTILIKSLDSNYKAGDTITLNTTSGKEYYIIYEKLK